ncbi:MAG: precorrin-2 C(20)-methyltransferase [Dehalobacterium sp.]
MAKFYGIGVGPGDPELLTIKAAKILGKIDVLLLPESQKGKQNIAYEIAADHINSEAKLISVEFPMVTDENIINQAGKVAAEVVERHVREGLNTAFITLGDPSVYSTYNYIVKHLPSDIEIQTVPGITSFCAAAAETNRSLVEGDEILSIIPATSSKRLMEMALDVTKSAVFMKVYNQKDKVLSVMEEYDLLDSSVLVQRCGFDDCTVDHDIKEGLSRDKQYLSIILTRKES